MIGNEVADSIVDEGSELNCLCSKIAARCGIKYIPISLTAMSAGSNLMELLGVVPHDITLNVHGLNPAVKIVLRNAVVVKNLGPSILVGEPGKMDNDIITFPKQKLIQFKYIHGDSIKIPYHSRHGKPSLLHQAYSTNKITVVYPGEALRIPVVAAMQCNAVNVSLRREFSFAMPTIQNAKKGYVEIENKSDNIIVVNQKIESSS